MPNRNTSYESNGPDVKLRGNAQQLHEKYIALAHDAASAGERISAEAYTQFADHYFRLHQASVGVTETKRHQDVAATVVSAEVASGQADDADARSGNAQTSDMASEASGAASVAARDSGDTDGKPARRRSRQNGKSATAADERNAASKPAADALSPAKLVEVVQDKAVAS